MRNETIAAGNVGTVASNISLKSIADMGTTMIDISSMGSLLPCTGNMSISATGTVLANAGPAMVQLSNNVAQQSSVFLNGGATGKVTIANALPVGTAQKIQMDSMTTSIDIANGNVPGAMQSISMCGATQSVEISAGGLPISPSIQMSPLGIKLSCGPTNFIEINPEGVSISGILVDVEALAQANVKGALVNVEAQAVCAVKGLLVQVN
ncbi:MAG: hypothetical protein AB8B55_13345 [Mariniblastus sp.]